MTPDSRQVDHHSAVWWPARAFRARPAGARIAAVILHSGDGAKIGDLDTLTARRDRSAHYYVTREGEVYQMVREHNAAYHAGQVDAREHNNLHTIGIETEHVDKRDDWPDRQVFAIGLLVASIRARHGEIPVLGHATVAMPRGRKIDPHDFPWLDLAAVVLANSPNAAIARLTSAGVQAPRLELPS